MTNKSTRREFFKSSLAAGVTLFIGLNAKGVFAAGATGASLNPFIKISNDGTLTIILKHFEMGQGASTGLATLIAEELDADWEKIETEFAPADASKYANLFLGMQGTGGSTSMANSYMQYRQAGAAARDVLVRAVAAKWNVPMGDITIDKGILKAGNKVAHFGEVVAEAAKLVPPTEPSIKSEDDFKLIGNENIHRIDHSSKTDGTAMFAMDIKVPGMVYVSVLHKPKFGAKLVSFDASRASELGGFIAAKALPNGEGVAVYANSTWNVLSARDAIEANWDFSAAEMRSSEQMYQDAAAAIENPTYDVKGEKSKTENALSNATKKIDVEFRLPFLAHAPMEPQNCVIEAIENGVLVHDGCQMPTLVKNTVASILELNPEISNASPPITLML